MAKNEFTITKEMRTLLEEYYDRVYDGDYSSQEVLTDYVIRKIIELHETSTGDSSVKKKRSKPSEKVEGWTEARYWSFIRSALRSAWRRYPVKWEVLKEASRAVTGQRHRTEYQCNECKQWFKGSDVQVDHVKPAGQLTDYNHLPSFVEGLYCGKENLQVLCSECHAIKTKEERKKK